ncbi:MAG TPA: hypothetical protein VKP65_06555 [Rhodothermales bacterium]|nr:hypothetical protein [Rhodothermales bacterium]
MRQGRAMPVLFPYNKAYEQHQQTLCEFGLEVRTAASLTQAY